MDFNRYWREYLYLGLIGVLPPLLTVATQPPTLKSFIKRLIFFFVFGIICWAIAMWVGTRIERNLNNRKK